jgi:hypothetical protein
MADRIFYRPGLVSFQPDDYRNCHFAGRADGIQSRFSVTDAVGSQPFMNDANDAPDVG